MNTLKAKKRSMDVKAKKLRREGFVTGNVIGREIKASIPVIIEKGDLDKLLKTDNKGSQIMLDIDGTQYDVLIKDISYNSMKMQYEEIDFQALVSNEKVHTVAEIIFENREMITTGVFQEDLTEVSYKAYPSAIVDKVKVDVGNMKLGDVLRVKDLEIAQDKDIDLVTDLEAVVASVVAVHNNVPDTDTDAEDEDTTAEA